MLESKNVDKVAKSKESNRVTGYPLVCLKY
jgi:hypothetical protein